MMDSKGLGKGQASMTAGALHRVRDVAVILAVTGLLLGATETALRLAGFEHRPPSPIVIWTPKEDRELESPDGTFRFHPHWFWEPRAGAAMSTSLTII